ncbi:hypothetical protein LTR84_001555 [Exophiala bonariae]|uniref:NAD(P)-binding domain-containing protein n=1 Tax=Exophiala bonariae TaxID=1690606 RepID=A0AAV9NGG8_9EURO|nr:hypothetical protein LTR84_001555 [Exophiala bonariae]
MAQSALTIGVLGPSGMGGSHIVTELLSRSHRVVGMSRNPEKIGSHSRYEPRSVDLENASIQDIGIALRNLDVVICAYGPHSSGVDAMKYMPFLETLRKIILASKSAKVGYFIMIGGCGSLYLPGTNICAIDSPEFFLAYWRSMADSYAHVTYLEKRFGDGAPRSDIRAYRSARAAQLEGRDTPEAEFVRESHERRARENDHARPLITACRTSLMFFEGNTSFDWTFISPPAMYRSGRKMGKYQTTIDYIPLKGEQDGPGTLEGRLLGITTFDFAVAVADEAERRQFKGKHWSVWGELSDDEPAPSPYIKISDLEDS